jgi:hypothetical protein
MNFLWLQKLLRGEVPAPTTTDASRRLVEMWSRSTIAEVESSLNRRWLRADLC